MININHNYLKSIKFIKTQIFSKTDNNSLLILTALKQSRLNLLIPLRQTTDTFLSSKPNCLEYNLYLQSVSHIPFRSPESTRTVKSILAHIDLNQNKDPCTISTTTYSRLIRPSFTPVPLLAYLHHRLTTTNSQPLPLPILLAFLSTYSKLSNPAKSSLFFAQIHAHPHTTPRTLQYASTLLLSAQHSQRAAHDVLTSNPTNQNSSQYHCPLPYNTSASLHVLSKDLSVPAQKLIETFLLLTSSLPNPPLLPLYTSLINGLVLRKRYHTARVFFTKLIKLIKSRSTTTTTTTSEPAIQMDLPSLAAGINALTRSGKPHEAFQVLESYYPPLLLASSSLVNPSSLTIPLLTFLTALNRISRPDMTALIFFLYPTLYPTSPAPNALMLNLLMQAGRTGIKMDLRVRRAKDDVPEHVKRLLRYFHANSSSSSSSQNKSALLDTILRKLNLRTSTLLHQIASSLGKNLAFEHVISKPLPPFGKQQQQQRQHNPRLAASNLILSHIGHPSRGGLRQFVSSAAYEGVPSGAWARVVFLRAVAGVGGGGARLWEVEAPAVSYVSQMMDDDDDDEEGGGGGGRPPALDSFRQLLAHQRFQRRRDEMIPYTPLYFKSRALWETLGGGTGNKPEPFYPSIVPTNANFFNYLLLLALSKPGTLPPIRILPDGRVLPHTSNTSTSTNTVLLPAPSPLETPLVLAWMRTLGVQPSTSTLAVSLVLWGEVCARVDAQHRDGRGLVGTDDDDGRRRRRRLGEAQYVALVEYLRGWVGEGRVPHWRTLEKWRGLVGRMRVQGGVVGEEGMG